MLFFPTPEGEQKVSVNLPGDPRTVTARSAFPAGRSIALQGGGVGTALRDSPTINFNLANIQHPVLEDACCSLGYEMSELIKHVSIAWNKGDCATWLSSFAENCENIINGVDEVWQLKRVEINDKTILLRYSNGEISGDAVLEDFLGQIDFAISTDWSEEITRSVTVRTTREENGDRITEIESHVPAGIREDTDREQRAMEFYNFCTYVKLMLTRHHDTGCVDLLRCYNLSRPDGNAKDLLTVTSLFHLLDGSAFAPTSDGYSVIRL